MRGEWPVGTRRLAAAQGLGCRSCGCGCHKQDSGAPVPAYSRSNVARAGGWRELFPRLVPHGIVPSYHFISTPCLQEPRMQRAGTYYSI